MHGLQLNHLSQSFQGVRALHDVSLHIPTGSVTALLGPSGSGKSTLLNLIAGLQRAQSGSILWDSAPLDAVPVHQRGIGFMFQDYALFPHLNVAQNITFGLRMAGWSKTEQTRRLNEVLDLVNLRGFERRDVLTLSGGEQQRVALARALAPRPRLLLLDEPLGALDRALRERLLTEVGDILRHTRQTAIYVTHDQTEAFTLADTVAILRAGELMQMATPREIYRAPASPWVARFLGLSNLFEGICTRGPAGWVLESPLGCLPLGESAPYTGRVRFLLRADALTLGEAAPQRLRGTLESVSFYGKNIQAKMRIAKEILTADFAWQTDLPPLGSPLTVSFDPQSALQFFALTDAL